MIASSEHGIGSRPLKIMQFLFASAALLMEMIEVLPSGWMYVYPPVGFQYHPIQQIVVIQSLHSQYQFMQPADYKRWMLL